MSRFNCSSLQSITKKLTHVVIPLFFLGGTPVITYAVPILIYNNDDLSSYVTGINGLEVDGIIYDATFHLGQSFNELWDANGNLIFGDDTSIFNRAPTFWGTQAGADEAAHVIAGLLGDDNFTTYLTSDPTRPTDRFYIPFEYEPFNHNVIGLTECDSRLDVESYCFSPRGQLNTGSGPLVSFQIASVPEPTTLLLMATGLIGVGFASRKRKKA